QAGRASRRGLPPPPGVQGADAGPDVGDVVPDLRARARAVDDPAQPRGAGLDPRDVRGAAAARQPPARPAGAPRRRVLRAQPAGAAEPGAGAGGLADPVHRRVNPGPSAGPRTTSRALGMGGSRHSTATYTFRSPQNAAVAEWQTR